MRQLKVGWVNFAVVHLLPLNGLSESESKWKSMLRPPQKVNWKNPHAPFCGTVYTIWLKYLDQEGRPHLFLLTEITASKRRLSSSAQITTKRVLRPLGSRSIHKPVLNVLFPQANWWCLAHNHLPFVSSDILVYFSSSLYPFQLPSPIPWDRFLNINLYIVT